MESNPFEAPEQTSSATPTGVVIYPDALNGRRFANYLLDSLFIYILVFVLMMVYSIYLIATGGTEADLAFLETPMANLMGVAFFFFYYLFFEVLFGLTPAKLITGTRVVSEASNTKPGITSMIIRTFCRIIPFEPFSFFLQSKPGGWHDHFSKTRTIYKRGMPLSAEEYQEMKQFYD